MPNDYDDATENHMDPNAYVESAIPIPQIRPGDPLGMNNAPDVDFLGVGTGGECLKADGSVGTRAKVDGSGDGGNSPAPPP